MSETKHIKRRYTLSTQNIIDFCSIYSQKPDRITDLRDFQ